MRGGSEWKLASYASIVVGSPIIDTATALAMRTQCTTATIIGAYGLRRASHRTIAGATGRVNRDEHDHQKALSPRFLLVYHLSFGLGPLRRHSVMWEFIIKSQYFSYFYFIFK